MREQLCQLGSEAAAPRPALECRLHSRQACDVVTSCQPTSAWGRADSRWPAVINDISLGGVRLIVRRRFERGIGLGVELLRRNGEEPYTVLAKVVHVQGLPDGTWALGCKFISELSEDELESLVPPSSAPVPDAAPSTLGVQEGADGTTSISEVLLELEVSPGRVVTCSVGRLAVPKSWPLAPGKKLTLNTDGPRVVSLRIEVVRCLLQGERWTLRGRLVRPTWEEVVRTLRR